MESTDGKSVKTDQDQIRELVEQVSHSQFTHIRRVPIAKFPKIRSNKRIFCCNKPLSIWKIWGKAFTSWSSARVTNRKRKWLRIKWANRRTTATLKRIHTMGFIMTCCRWVESILHRAQGSRFKEFSDPESEQVTLTWNLTGSWLNWPEVDVTWFQAWRWLT